MLWKRIFLFVIFQFSKHIWNQYFLLGTSTILMTLIAYSHCTCVIVWLRDTYTFFFCILQFNKWENEQIYFFSFFCCFCCCLRDQSQWKDVSIQNVCLNAWTITLIIWFGNHLSIYICIDTRYIVYNIVKCNITESIAF